MRYFVILLILLQLLLGLLMSRVIFRRMVERNLVVVFMPFLSLERQHVKIYVRNEFQRRDMVFTEEMVKKVADELIYWPAELKLFSTSGCKRVAQNVDLLLEEEWGKDEL